MASETRKKLLVIEDDPRLIEDWRRILHDYIVDVVAAQTAEKAWPQLFPEVQEQRPDAVILDVMLPYGSKGVQQALDPKHGDLGEIDTGLALLKQVREDEKNKGWPPLWFAVTTARSAPGFVKKLEDLAGTNGAVFLKPYDPTVLEMELCRVLGLECRLPEWIRPSSDR